MIRKKEALELVERSRKDWQMESFRVITENRGGEQQKPQQKKETEAFIGGRRKKKIGFRKAQLWEKEMEIGCVGGSRFKARMGLSKFG